MTAGATLEGQGLDSAAGQYQQFGPDLFDSLTFSILTSKTQLVNLHDSMFYNSINNEHFVLTNLDLSLRLLSSDRNSSIHKE